MDVQARRAWRGQRELELTRTEFELLELLVRNAGIVLDHSTIYDRIWGYDFGPGSKNLAVYVGYLRRKLDEPGAAAADPHGPRASATSCGRTESGPPSAGSGPGAPAGRGPRRGRVRRVLAQRRAGRRLRPVPALRTAFAVSFAAVRRRRHRPRRVPQLRRGRPAGPRRPEIGLRRGRAGPARRGARQPLAPADFASSDPDHDGPRPRPHPAHPHRCAGPGRRRLGRGPAAAPRLPVTGAGTGGSPATPAAGRIRGAQGRRTSATTSTASRPSRSAAAGARCRWRRSSATPRTCCGALQQRTVLLVAAVVVAAGLFGWWLARRITRPAGAARPRPPRTSRGPGGSASRCRSPGYDEVARLGRAFDRMLGRLAQSEEDQRRLVQDAGHELRTPLTSLRTNISLLRRIDELPPDSPRGTASPTSARRPGS